MPRVAIGIQARTTSERLPNKILMEIDGQKVLDYILTAAEDAAAYLNRQKPISRNGVVFQPYEVDVFLLTPSNDPVNEIYRKSTNIISHDNENDVLTRYVELQKLTKADYVVRLTGDCIFMPEYMISRVIKTSVIKAADYASNVVHRTSPEGFDVEVLSARMLEYLDQSTVGEMNLREHVTLFLVQDILKHPEFYKTNYKIWHLFEHYDYSRVLKTSIDDMNEYLIAKRNIESVIYKKMEASKSGYVAK